MPNCTRPPHMPPHCGCPAFTPDDTPVLTPFAGVDTETQPIEPE